MRQAPRADLRKDQFSRVNDNLVAFYVVLFHMKARLLRLSRMWIKAAAPPFLNLYIQSIARLVDEIVPIL
jgi:hypothetical protein